jgi:hypothetical protein
MAIEIRRDKNGELAVLVSFDTCSKRFESNHERNTFFRGLYGWNQVIKKKDKKYTYRREGLLDDIPHIKVDNSVFIVALKRFQEILEYLREWEEKVNYKTFRVLLEDEKFEKLKRGKKIEIR